VTGGRHVFLTGERGLGKSTIIRAAIERTGATADGFMTFWEGDSLFISAYGLARPDERHLICRRQAPPLRPDTRVFDGPGAAWVAGSGTRGVTSGVTVMDELGFLEAGAAGFRAAVSARLARPAPVVGALRARHTPWLDSVRALPDVTVWEVTAGNQADVADRLARWLGDTI